jgi:hypothetical protein
MDLVDRWKELPQYCKAVMPLISERVCKHRKQKAAPCKPFTGEQCIEGSRVVRSDLRTRPRLLVLRELSSARVQQWNNGRLASTRYYIRDV